ncbi:MAG: YsnF/AvaK domain-containing protein [Ginsengibacter sp.]
MQTVIGLFDNANEAQQAVQQLKSAGFSDENIDISAKKDNSHSSGGYTTDSYPNDSVGNSSESVSGYTTGSYADDNVGNSSTGTSGHRSSDHTTDGDSFGDKVSHFFKNLFGGDDDQADRYSTVANRAGAIVTVHAQTESEAEEAADILDDAGAVDVDERSAQYGYTGGSNSSSSDFKTDSDDSNTLNVIKEDVNVSKREMQTGGVRLRSKIVERPVEETLRLREERVTVERTPVDRAATNADFQNFKEGTIEMTERAEVADVTKQARVVEEIKLSKEVNEREETIRETARDTKVDVEDIEDEDVTGRTDKTRNL